MMAILRIPVVRVMAFCRTLPPLPTEKVPRQKPGDPKTHLPAHLTRRGGRTHHAGTWTERTEARTEHAGSQNPARRPRAAPGHGQARVWALSSAHARIERVRRAPHLHRGGPTGAARRLTEAPSRAARGSRARKAAGVRPKRVGRRIATNAAWPWHV